MSTRRERRIAQRELDKTNKRGLKADQVAGAQPRPTNLHLPILRQFQQLPQWRSTEAAAKTVLSGGRTLSRAIEAVAKVGDLIDDDMVTAAAASDCKRGCFFCCHVRVDLTIPELARIMSFAREHLTSEELEALKNRASVTAAGARGKTPLTYPVQPCALLANGECSVYEVRPLACRAEHSFNVKNCQLCYETGEDVPAERDEVAFADALLRRYALEASLSDAGFASRTYELQQALFIALSKPAAFELWARRQDVFEKAKTGGSLLAELANRA